MPHSLDHAGDLVSQWWHAATPTDFGCIALAVVVLGWFVSKYYS